MFENEYLMDKRLLKEYVYNSIGKKYIINGFFVFITGLIMYLLIEINVRYVVLTCSLIGLYFAIFFPGILINSFEKTGRQLNNGKIEKTNIKFNTNILMKEGNVQMQYEYSQIKKISETKNFFVLSLGNESAILVHKEGFIKGNKENFLEYMYKKINI